jgi:hypothetical protein
MPARPVSRAAGTQYGDEVLERVLDRGMVLDGLSHLVALAGTFKISARSSKPPAVELPIARPLRPREFAPLGPLTASSPYLRLTSVQHVSRATLPSGGASTPLAVRSTRVIHGDFYADILPDRKHPGSIWLYVVQRSGSKDVLAMGSSRSEGEAEADALETIRDLRKAVAAASGR